MLLSWAGYLMRYFTCLLALINCVHADIIPATLVYTLQDKNHNFYFFPSAMNSDIPEENLMYICPNSSWLLSEDKTFCYRMQDPCWTEIDHVPEVKLLAAIAFGEASTLGSYQETAAIANATVRRRDAEKYASVNQLITANPHFSYVVHNGNARFIKLMCGKKDEFTQPYTAADNALNHGYDFAQGGCFWDGYDLKTRGPSHPKFQAGFQYSKPEHDIFITPEPPQLNKNGPYGTYSVTYTSTVALGGSIFWKLHQDYLKAKGAMQCR
jgi:hypothetical protein